MDIRWSLIAALAVFGGVIFNSAKILKRGRFNGISLLMFSYGLLVMVSVVTAYNPSLAQAWAVDFIKILLIAMIATLVIEHFWQVRIIAIMICMVLGYIAYEINFYYFMQNARLDVFHYGFGGLDNNGAGLMLAMGLPFAYYFGMTKWKGNSHWQRIVAAIIGLLLLHAVMLLTHAGRCFRRPSDCSGFAGINDRDGKC